MRASLSANSLRAAVGSTFRVAALCLLLGAIWSLLGCGGAYRNPMATTAPMSTPTSNPPMPMHRSHK